MKAHVLNCIELPGDAGALILYDWMADEVRDGRNLIHVGKDGSELWRAKPPFYGDSSREDCFTKIEWDGDTLTGFSWSCYRVQIDLQDGAVTILAFTK